MFLFKSPKLVALFLFLVTLTPVHASLTDMARDTSVKTIMQAIFSFGALIALLSMIGDFKDGDFKSLFAKGFGVAILVGAAAQYDAIIDLIPG